MNGTGAGKRNGRAGVEVLESSEVCAGQAALSLHFAHRALIPQRALHVQDDREPVLLVVRFHGVVEQQVVRLQNATELRFTRARLRNGQNQQDSQKKHGAGHDGEPRECGPAGTALHQEPQNLFSTNQGGGAVAGGAGP